MCCYSPSPHITNSTGHSNWNLPNTSFGIAMHSYNFAICKHPKNKLGILIPIFGSRMCKSGVYPKMKALRMCFGFHTKFVFRVKAPTQQFIRTIRSLSKIQLNVLFSDSSFWYVFRNHFRFFKLYNLLLWRNELQTTDHGFQVACGLLTLSSSS